MESFFLAETTKYLYLLFDPDNFIHNDGRHGKVWNTAGGRECIIDGGGYIFNTGKQKSYFFFYNHDLLLNLEDLQILKYTYFFYDFIHFRSPSDRSGDIILLLHS